MLKKFPLFTGLALLAAMGSQASLAAPLDFSKVDVAPTKVGDLKDLAPSIKPYCGTKKIKVALSDGFGGNAWRKTARKEFEDEAAKCPNITGVAYTDAQGSPEKQIADIRSLTAQGYDVIVVFPDAGEALLKAMRDATNAGVAVIPYQGGLFPGKPGVDWTALATPDVAYRGEIWATWIAKSLDGKGNVLFYGGSPGSTLMASMYDSAKKVFAKYPNIKLLETQPVVTNWDPAQYQKATTGLLAKYPQIDALFADYATGVMGAVRAFQAAGRPIPLVTGVEGNELSCAWQDNKAKNPHFQIANITAGTFYSRLALRKGVAAVQGIPNAEPSIVREEIFADSASSDAKMRPVCDTALPPDAAPRSGGLTPEQLKQLFAK